MFITIISHNHIDNKLIRNIMKKLSVKFAGVFAVVAFALTASTPASGQTIEELQAMIATLQQQIAALSGGTTSPTTTTSYTFTADLTLGSTGADVTALQTFLEARGHLTMPVGVSKGYFGQLTRAALAQYQMSKGITPAVGYFGPITRAAVNQDSTSAVTPGTPTTPGTGLQGGAGDIVVTSTSVDTESEVAEGDLEKVLAFRIEAEDSDVRITNLRVTVENTDAPTSNRRPDRYLDSIEVWMGNTRVGTIDPRDMTRDGNEYSRNVALNNAVIREGIANRETFYVAFRALNNIDSLDMQTASFDVTVDNIRFVDGSGAMFIATDVETATGITFTDPATAGDVRMRISLGSNNPGERTIEVNEFSSTNNIDLLEFRLRAESRDMVLEQLQVALESSEDLSDVLSDVELRRGNTRIADVSSFANAGTQTITFDLYDDHVIEEGDTETLRVVARVKQKDGNFADGTTLKASLVNTASGFILEDKQGNAITNFTGSANGFEQKLFVNGAEIDYVSSSISNQVQGTSTRDFTLVFDVTALGEDLVVDRTDFATVAGTQFSIIGGGVVTPASASLTSTAPLNVNEYRVSEGQTRRFTLTVTVEATVTGQKRVKLDAIAGVAPATVIETASGTVNL